MPRSASLRAGSEPIRLRSGQTLSMGHQVCCAWRILTAGPFPSSLFLLASEVGLMKSQYSPAKRVPKQVTRAGFLPRTSFVPPGFLHLFLSCDLFLPIVDLTARYHTRDLAIGRTEKYRLPHTTRKTKGLYNGQFYYLLQCYTAALSERACRTYSQQSNPKVWIVSRLRVEATFLGQGRTDRNDLVGQNQDDCDRTAFWRYRGGGCTDSG